MYNFTFSLRESSMLMSVCGPKGKEIVGGRGKLLNEELRNTYSSLYIVRVMNSGSMMKAGHWVYVRVSECIKSYNHKT
jgi:hypothetical protein